MAYRQKDPDTLKFGDSDDNIDTNTIEPPLLENEEKSRSKRSRKFRRRTNNKKKQAEAQSTSTDENVAIQEYPTSSEDKLEAKLMAYRQKDPDTSKFGDSDDNIVVIDTSTIEPPLLENEEKSRSKRKFRRRTHNKEKQAQAQSTSTDENVAIQEYPTSSEDKLEAKLMAYRQKDPDTLKFGDSDDNIDTNTIEPPLLENEEKSRSKRKFRRRTHNKEKQVQAQSTSTDENVAIQEYPTSSEDKLEVSGHPSQQQMFDPKIFIVSGLGKTTSHKNLFGYLQWVTLDDLKELTLLGAGKAVAEVGKDISGFQKLKKKMHSRKLEGMQIKINRVHACDSILVSGLSPSVTGETILLYFENGRRSGGGDVSDVFLCNHKDSNSYGAVVNFVNPEVIANVIQKEHVLESQKLAVKKYFPQIDAENINARSCAISLQREETEEEGSSAQHTSVEVDDDIMQFVMNGVHFQELKGKLDEVYAKIEWNFGSNRATIWRKADLSYVESWVNVCTTVFVQFLDRFNKSSLSLEKSIQKAVSVALPRLAELVSPGKASWKQIEEKQELVVVCLKEETATVRKSMREFVERIKKEEILKMYKKETVTKVDELDPMKKSIDLQGVTNIEEKSEKELEVVVKSQRPKERALKVSNGVARFVKENLSREINGIKARLKNDQVDINVNIKTLYPSVISYKGTDRGLDSCEKSISELCQTVIEKKKDLCLPGLSKLLLSETAGQPYLKVIEMNNNVVIEMTSERRGGVKEISQSEVKSLRDELEKEKKRKSSLADDRSRFTTKTKTVESSYDLCNFTTKEGIRVSWKYGNIADETADILVNSAQSDLSKPTACGKALSIVGGPRFTQACLDQGSIGRGGVVRTSGGNLSCKYVLHAVCCSWDNYQGKAEELLRNLVREILRKCEQCRATSLAMPTIGTGNHMFPEDVVFRIFREEFKIFSFSQCMFIVKDIRIVVFDKQLPTQPPQVHGKQKSPSVLNWISSMFTQLLTSSQATNAEAPQSTPITSFTPLNTGEPKQAINLQVFALSNKNIDAAFDEVNAFVKNQTTTKKIEREKVFDVFLEHWSKVQELARHHDVKITCQTSSVALIEGLVTNVSDCKELLMRLITEFVEEERKRNQLEYISKNVQWHYLQGSREVEYGSELNGLIETASMENKQFLEITRSGQQYEIDLIRREEKNKKTGRTEKITRKSLVESSSDTSLPSNWDPQPQGQVVHLVTLSRSSTEFQDVLSLFNLKGGSGSRVSKIQRIQNPRLYMSFLAAKKSMNGADNEMQLFHGTSASNTESINANNFSRSFAGVNGVMYGDGVYFARDSSYSLQYSRLHENFGSSKMYVARVLVGRYTTGGKGMKAPPSRNDPGNPGVRYDSVVDNVRNPSVFVIFVDNHCYPEYLITFAGANPYTF